MLIRPTLVRKAFDRSFNGRGAKNSADRHKSLLILCSFFLESLLMILMTFTEIQKILYSSGKKRNVVKLFYGQNVLRLHNITFKHAMPLKIHFANKLKKLIERDFSEV